MQPQLRSSLSLKVLILVALPLIVQWGSLVWLANLQLAAEHALAQSLHANEVANALINLRVDMYKVIVLASGEKRDFSGQEDVARSHIGTLEKDYTTLLELTRDDDPALHKALEVSREEARQSIYGLIEIKKSLENDPANSDGRSDMWRDVRLHTYRVLKNDFTRYSREQASLAQLSPTIQADFRRKQLAVMIGLALATLALAVISALYLIRGLTMRIAKVNDNAYRLASARPLNPVMRGGDEIAKLDQTFHKMALALKEAEELKQEVVVMVTHDLRTPLATLQNILRFLRSGNYGKLDQKGSEYVMVANRNVERMSNLVNDLLDIEKVKSGLMTLDKQALELADCFVAARELAGAFADEAQVKIEIVDTDLMVNADQDRVTRVLANLIANAVKFSPRGSSVKISARQEGNWVATTVDDSGPGIPPEKLQFIFERFHQVESETLKGKGGSGLGLTICRAIVELHGGKIWAQNMPSGGSRFTFTLPAA